MSEKTEYTEEIRQEREQQIVTERGTRETSETARERCRKQMETECRQPVRQSSGDIYIHTYCMQQQRDHPRSDAGTIGQVRSVI